MKKLLTIGLLLCASVAFADGPLFKSSNTFTQQEFVNVYWDLKNPRIDSGSAKILNITSSTITALTVSTITATSSATVTNATITNLTVGTLTTTGVLGKLVKWNWTNTTSNTNTTSGTFGDTALTMAFTKVNAADYLIVFVFGTMRSSVMSNSGSVVGLKRDSTQLMAQGQVMDSGVLASVPLESAVAIFWVDLISDTSSHTYTVQLRASSGGETASFPNSKDSAMLILEVTP